MTMTRPLTRFVLAALLSAAAVAGPRAQGGEPITVPLSDPGRVATIRAEIFAGDITIRGENRKDVLVTTTSGGGRGRGRQGRDTGAAAGLTRLTQGGGFTITEADNVVAIESGPMRPVNIEVRVPSRADLRVSGVNGSLITVENVEGAIEVEHTNGSIRAINVAGAVVAETTNGNVSVTLTRLTADKAMAFTSFNGNVDVTLPATAKANLRMRSDNGDVYTDFDVQVRSGTPPQAQRRGSRNVIEVNQSIYGTINGGGPEFELRTFNGNIYVRKAAQQ